MRKLATSPVGLPSNSSSSDAENTASRSFESASHATLGIFAATSANLRSPVAEFHSNARIPLSPCEPIRTRWRPIGSAEAKGARVAAQDATVAAAEVRRKLRRVSVCMAKQFSPMPPFTRHPRGCSTSLAPPWKRRTRNSSKSIQLEVHVHRGFHFHRFAVQQVRPVLPLLYRVDCCLLQQRWSTHHAKILDGAALRDHRLQDHGAFDAHISSDDRILRHHFADQHPNSDAGGDLFGPHWGPHNVRIRPMKNSIWNARARSAGCKNVRVDCRARLRPIGDVDVNGNLTRNLKRIVRLARRCRRLRRVRYRPRLFNRHGWSRHQNGYRLA